MLVQLSPDLKDFVQEKVASGSFGSEAEVMITALELMKRDEEAALSRIREEVEIGAIQAERGEFVNQTISEIFDEAEREYRDSL